MTDDRDQESARRGRCRAERATANHMTAAPKIAPPRPAAQEQPRRLRLADLGRALEERKVISGRRDASGPAAALHLV